MNELKNIVTEIDDHWMIRDENNTMRFDNIEIELRLLKESKLPRMRTSLMEFTIESTYLILLCIHIF